MTWDRNGLMETQTCEKWPENPENPRNSLIERPPWFTSFTIPYLSKKPGRKTEWEDDTKDITFSSRTRRIFVVSDTSFL